MTPTLLSDCGRDERLNEVLLAYLEALPLNRAPERQQILAAHPDLRHDLEAFLADYDDMERRTKPLRQADIAPDFLAPPASPEGPGCLESPSSASPTAAP